MKTTVLIKKNKSSFSVQTQAEKEPLNLKSVSFHNIRAFGDNATVPIAPVNLIFGNNNAGKSSIFHSFLWIREVLEKGNLNVHRPEPSGNYIDLGGIKNFIHKNSNGDSCKTFGFSLEILLPETKKNYFFERILELSLREIKETLQFRCTFRRFMKRFDSKKIFQIIESLKKLNQDKFKEALNQLLSFYFKKDLSLKVKIEFDSSKIEKTKEVFANICIKPKIKLYINNILIIQSTGTTNKNQESLDGLRLLTGFLPKEVDPAIKTFQEAICEMVKTVPAAKIFKKKISRNSSFLSLLKRKVLKSLSSDVGFSTLGVNQFFKESIGLKAFPRSAREPRQRRAMGFIKPFSSFKKMNSNDRYSEGEFIFDSFNEVLFVFLTTLFRELRESVFNFFGKIQYLAGYRIYLEREINQQTLRDIQQNDPYGTLEIKKLLTSNENLSKLNSILKNFNSPFLVSKKGNVVKKVVLINRKIKKGDWSFKDFGFGWSQVFPFILKLLDKNFSALFVEQPELHLSSSYQQKLMDLILDNKFENSVNKNEVEKQNNSLFLECHSDMMVYRLLRRLRENRNKRFFKSSDFSILHIKEGQDCSVIQQIKLSNDGFLTDKWVDGVLELAAKDLVEQHD